MTARALTPAVLLLLALLPRPVAADGLSAYQGSFVFVGGEREREAVDAAADEVLEPVSVLLRGLARKRLEEGLVIIEMYAFTVEKDGVTITAPPYDPRWSPVDGRSVYFSVDGRRISIRRLVMGGRTLWERAARGKSSRQNVYRLSADGTRLQVDVTVSHPRLPADVTFSLSYERIQ